MLSFVLISMISNIVGDSLIDLSFCRYVVAHVHRSGQQIQAAIFAPKILLCWVKWSIHEYIWLDIICFLRQWIFILFYFIFFWVWKEINSSGNGRHLVRWMRRVRVSVKRNFSECSYRFRFDLIWFTIIPSYLKIICRVVVLYVFSW